MYIYNLPPPLFFFFWERLNTTHIQKSFATKKAIFVATILITLASVMSLPKKMFHDLFFSWLLNSIKASLYSKTCLTNTQLIHSSLTTINQGRESYSENQIKISLPPTTKLIRKKIQCPYMIFSCCYGATHRRICPPKIILD